MSICSLREMPISSATFRQLATDSLTSSIIDFVSFSDKRKYIPTLLTIFKSRMLLSISMFSAKPSLSTEALMSKAGDKRQPSAAKTNP